MMYWGFPTVTPADRLARSPALDRAAIRVSPAEAAAAARVDRPTEVRINTFDGRPVYRFRAGRAGDVVVYADTGERLTDVARAFVDRAAAAWTGQPASAARVDAIDDVDQWTIQSRVRDVRPLKYTWPDGQQVYVSRATGEVVQYTTPRSRWAAYLGAIPHWLYFTPLRRHGALWSRVVIWSSGAGAIAALLGIVVGMWVYSPRRRYRDAGAPAAIPYRGYKRWHTIFGLCFGAGAVTWAFSGMLSMDPLPQQQAADARRASATMQQSLRRPPRLEDFASRSPAEALAQLPDLAVKELELVAVAGEPVYVATAANGATRIVPVRGAPRSGFDEHALIDAIRREVQPIALAEARVVDRYDRYYLDRRGDRPLPVVLVRLDDGNATRYYIDPRTGRIAASYSARNWIARWLYHGLHSLDFPWLYSHRPLWDFVVIAFMTGGTTLSVTALVLAWGVLARRLGQSG